MYWSRLQRWLEKPRSLSDLILFVLGLALIMAGIGLWLFWDSPTRPYLVDLQQATINDPDQLGLEIILPSEPISDLGDYQVESLIEQIKAQAADLKTKPLSAVAPEWDFLDR